MFPGHKDVRERRQKPQEGRVVTDAMETSATPPKDAAAPRMVTRSAETAFGRYPRALRTGGLVFTSGVRGGAAGAGFDDLPVEGKAKRQGYGTADQTEGEVAVSSWRAHEVLEAALADAGSATDQILRQHVWQRDKRFFPVYEDIRKHWQPSPAPSSGLGVADLSGAEGAWIGLDAIAVDLDAVARGAAAAFTPREVVAAPDHGAAPSASHYSQAVRSGPLLFTAGHIPIRTSAPGKPLIAGFDDLPEEGRFLATGRSHPDSRDGPIAAQSWFVYSELARLLAGAGLSLADTVLATVYLADLRDLAVFHRVHRHFFGDAGPALTVIGFDEVGHRGCRIEIELTALDPAGGLARRAVGWPIAAPLAAPAAVQAGDFLFLSGIAAFDAAGRFVGGTVADQATQAFGLLGQVLGHAGAGMADLAKLTVYAATAADLPAIEAAAAAALDPAALPALEVVLVHGPGPVPGSRVQLEAIAHRAP